MQQSRDVEAMLDELIEREGGYISHPADRGGPTRFVTQAARRHRGTHPARSFSAHIRRAKDAAGAPAVPAPGALASFTPVSRRDWTAGR